MDHDQGYSWAKGTSRLRTTASLKGMRLRVDRISALMVSILLPTAWVAAFSGMSGFVFDDFRNFRDAQLAGLSLDYLLRPVGDFYFSPGHRLGNWVIQTYFPMRFDVARIFTVVTFAISLFVLYLILVELSRLRAGALFLTVLYGLSTIQVAVSQWWTSALQIYPATLFSFVCTLCFILYYRTRRRPLLVLSVAALIVALLFHSKAAYVPLYLVLIRVLLLQADVPLRTTVTAAVREWRVWLAYFVPVVVFMAAFLSMFVGGKRSLDSLWQYLTILWVRVFVPGLFGALIPNGSSSPLIVAGIVMAHVAFVGAVAWALLYVRGAWRGFIVFVIVFLANAIPIGLTRIHPPFATPETAAYSLRYNVEATYMFVLVVAFVLSQRRGTKPVLVLAPWKFLAFMCFTGYVVLAWAGGRTLSGPGWIGRQASHYVKNVQNGLRNMSYSPETSAFVDAVVPESVVFPILAPANTVSEVLPVIDDQVVFDVADRNMLRVTDDGSVQPVVFHGEDGGEVGALLQRGALILTSPTAGPSEKGVCVTADKTPVLVVFTPRAPVSAPDGDLYVALRYSSSTRRPVAFAVEPIGVAVPDGNKVMMLSDGGEQTNLFPLDGRTLVRLYVGVLPDSHVCLKHIEVGYVSVSG